MVTPNPEDLARIKRDQAEVKAARSVHSALRGFLESFRWPAAGIITGVYGSRRVLNGEPRNPHYGIDIAAPAGTPVLAPASGRVTLAHPDMYYTGATLILDHGLGVSSTFLHLQDIDVGIGQTVAAGEQIGRVGSSGRSTGPHLDWRINWFDVRVDPALLVGPMPSSPNERGRRMKPGLLAVILALGIAAAHAASPVDRVVVRKSDGLLQLMVGTRVVRQFPIYLGGNPVGHKRHQGDRRTPEGRYVLHERKRQSRFYRALAHLLPQRNRPRRGRSSRTVSRRRHHDPRHAHSRETEPADVRWAKLDRRLYRDQQSPHAGGLGPGGVGHTNRNPAIIKELSVF